MSNSRFVVALLVTASLPGFAASPASAQPLQPLAAVPYVSGLSSPVAFIQDPSAPHVQYVVQQGGRIRVVTRNTNGTATLRTADYLNLGTGVISTGGERGLLGMACPVDYASFGYCYVNFTDPNGHTVVARFKRSVADPLVADPTSRLDLRWSTGARTITQPYANHNGGTLRFGPDGNLYIGMGDGGAGDDPEHRAQDPTTLLGKMLRVDVHVPPSNGDGMRVPADNPFLDSNPVAARPEIWAFGLRNPWKFSFDDPRLGGTGALIIGDVGQGLREEIDYEPAGAGGRNYGWRNREGALDHITSLPLAYEPPTDPIFDYESTNDPNSLTKLGDAVTGGAVYRGLALDPAYRGRYFFADSMSGRVFSLALTVDPTTHEAVASDLREHTAELGGTSVLGNITAIEADADGELYIVSLNGTVFRIAPGDSSDRDNDTLNDAWERRYGLDPGSAAGADGASGDPDNDGRTNAMEFSAGTHPRGTVTRYLAEGATSSFFELSLDLANSTDTNARVVVRFLRSDGQVFPMTVLVPSQRRVSINPRMIAGLATAEFSTVVESDTAIAVSRDMHWDATRRYGAHAERAVDAPTNEWFLAEGATHSGLQLFYLLQNPNAFAVDVDVTYLFPTGAPLTKRYSLAATSRRTLWINTEDPRLQATDVSAQLKTTDNSGIVVERAMYLDRPNETFGAGHDGAGATAAANEWYLAEGATMSIFDLFVLIANPGTQTAQVQARFLLPNGSSTTTTRTIGPQSRDTIWVDQESGLEATPVSTVVTSLNNVPIVVERAMWWGSSSTDWYESHVSLGSTTVGAEWLLAEGASGYGDNAQTYVLISNTGGVADTVDVTVLYEDRAPETKTYTVGAGARFTVSIGDEFPNAKQRRFGVHVEARAVSTLAVEGSVYNDADGQFWGAGTNLLATRIR